eukprot:648940-Pyramimonas_sp.AAC.1
MSVSSPRLTTHTFARPTGLSARAATGAAETGGPPRPAPPAPPADSAARRHPSDHPSRRPSDHRGPSGPPRSSIRRRRPLLGGAPRLADA